MRVLFEIFEDCIRNIGGGLGRRIRRCYYRRRLQSCGTNLNIDIGVVFENPGHISLGNNVWIDRYAVLIAGIHQHTNVRQIENADFQGTPGSISIGDDAHIGLRAVIQGHGGVEIGNHFTCSANCTIHSLSNDPARCRYGTIGSTESPVFYVESPVAIRDNVWLGLAVNVLGCGIGDDCFMLPGSLVTGKFADNSVIGGNPAKRVRARFSDAD